MKVNRQAGIHLHSSIGLKKGASMKDPYPYEKQFYWILIARNGKTIARSSETYKGKGSAVKSIAIAAKLFASSVGMFGGCFIDHTKGGVEFTNYYDHKLK